MFVFVCAREYKEPSISEQTNNTISKLRCKIRPGFMNEGRLFEKMAKVVHYVRGMNNRLISWQHSSEHFRFVFHNVISSCPINTTVPKIVSLLLFRNIRIKTDNLILKIVWLHKQ